MAHGSCMVSTPDTQFGYLCNKCLMAVTPIEASVNASCIARFAIYANKNKSETGVDVCDPSSGQYCVTIHTPLAEVFDAALS